MNRSQDSLNRRELLNVAALTGFAAALPDRSDAAAPENQFKIIDTNVSLFQWPFRRLPLDDTAALVGGLRHLGITQAWAGSFEGPLHRDLSAVNQRLVNECARYSELVPMGTINPGLHGWEEDFHLCCEKHRMTGIRIYPNYHQYTLDDPRCVQLLNSAAENHRLVQIVVAMEDVRTQHQLVQVPDVDLSPLTKLLPSIPELRVQILNARSSQPALSQIAAWPSVFFDTSRFDGTDGVAKLLSMTSKRQVVYGSHSPFLTPESALIRVHESDLSEADLRALLWENAAATTTRQL